MKEFLPKHKNIGTTFLQKVFVRKDEFYEIIFGEKNRKVSTKEPHRKINKIIFRKTTFRKSLRKNLRKTKKMVPKVYETINGGNENRRKASSPI